MLPTGAYPIVIPRFTAVPPRTDASSNAANVLLPVTDRLDNGLSVFRRPKSRFLDRFFAPASRRRYDSEVDSIWQASPQPPHGVAASLITHTRRGARVRGANPTRAGSCEATFQERGSNFQVECARTSLTMTNKCILWMDADLNLALSTGLVMHVPQGFFGLLRCVSPGEGYACPTDIVEPSNRSPEVHILNTARRTQFVYAGAANFHVAVFPYFAPEPWQLCNVDPPADEREPCFLLRLRSALRLEARSASLYPADATHFCAASDCCVLVIGTRHLSRAGVLLDPMVWRENTVPLLKLVNTARLPLTLRAGTPVARVIFTARGFATAPAGFSPIGRLCCPTPLSTFRCETAAAPHAAPADVRVNG